MTSFKVARVRNCLLGPPHLFTKTQINNLGIIDALQTKNDNVEEAVDYYIDQHLKGIAGYDGSDEEDDDSSDESYCNNKPSAKRRSSTTARATAASKRTKRASPNSMQFTPNKSKSTTTTTTNNKTSSTNNGSSKSQRQGGKRKRGSPSGGDKGKMLHIILYLCLYLGFILTILNPNSLTSFIDIDGERLSAGKSSKKAKVVASTAKSSNKRPARRAAAPKSTVVSCGKRQGSPTTVKEKPSKRIAGGKEGKAKDDIAGE